MFCRDQKHSFIIYIKTIVWKSVPNICTAAIEEISWLRSDTADQVGWYNTVSENYLHSVTSGDYLRRLGSEAVGGGGGPFFSNSSKYVINILSLSSATQSNIKYLLSF